jgi:hypothetical protein
MDVCTISDPLLYPVKVLLYDPGNISHLLPPAFPKNIFRIVCAGFHSLYKKSGGHAIRNIKKDLLENSRQDVRWANDSQSTELQPQLHKR